MTGNIKEIRSLVAKSQYKDAISTLNGFLLDDMKKNDLALIESRLIFVEKQNRIGLLNFDSLIVEKNKIGVNILNFASELYDFSENEIKEIESGTPLVDTIQINQLIEGQRQSLRYFLLITAVTLILAATFITMGLFESRDLIKIVLWLGGGLMLITCFFSFRQIMTKLEKINVFKILLLQLEKALVVESNSYEIHRINNLVWKKIEQSILN